MRHHGRRQDVCLVDTKTQIIGLDGQMNKNSVYCVNFFYIFATGLCSVLMQTFTIQKDYKKL